MSRADERRLRYTSHNLPVENTVFSIYILSSLGGKSPRLILSLSWGVNYPTWWAMEQVKSPGYMVTISWGSFFSNSDLKKKKN